MEHLHKLDLRLDTLLKALADARNENSALRAKMEEHEIELVKMIEKNATLENRIMRNSVDEHLDQTTKELLKKKVDSVLSEIDKLLSAK